MRRKRDMSSEEEELTESIEIIPQRPHKKMKKQKRGRADYDSDAVDVVSEVNESLIGMHYTSPISAAEKLKYQTVTTSGSSSRSTASKSQKKKKSRNKDSGTSSEEERWLDAIESGKLEEVDDELKKIKDPKLMTARQRAMYERGADKDLNLGGEVLMALPSGYKEKVMTAEAIQKAQLKSQKRKQLADEKREKDKKKTMERLLKKQDSKAAKANKSRHTKSFAPTIMYRNTIQGAILTFPPNIDLPFLPQTVKDPPKPVLCAMPDCCNIKKYNCSKTNVPLCSFKCYKHNVASIKHIFC